MRLRACPIAVGSRTALMTVASVPARAKSRPSGPTKIPIALVLPRMIGIGNE